MEGKCEECKKSLKVKEVEWLSITVDGEVKHFCNVGCATKWQDKHDDLS